MDKLANVLAEQFNCTVEYAKQHLPELMHDYCMYYGITNLIMAIISAAVLIICAVVVVQMVKSYRKCCKSGNDTVFFEYFFCGTIPSTAGLLTIGAVILCVIVFAVILPVSTADAIEALCFPDVYILEKVLEVL